MAPIWTPANFELGPGPIAQLNLGSNNPPVNTADWAKKFLLECIWLMVVVLVLDDYWFNALRKRSTLFLTPL